MAQVTVQAPPKGIIASVPQVAVQYGGTERENKLF